MNVLNTGLEGTRLQIIDDYAKNRGPGEVGLLCSFYHESLRTWIKTIVNKFSIANQTAFIFGLCTLRRYLKLIVNMSFIAYKVKVSGAKDHGKSCIKVRPPLFHHLLRNRLLDILQRNRLLDILQRNSQLSSV